mgnify:CR=1 FL=1
MSGNARRSGAREALVVSVTLGVLAGCSTTPEPVLPLSAPPVRVAARWYAGTPLSGPRPRETEKTSAADAVGVRLSLFALEKIPERLLDPLGSRTILIASAREDTPVHAATKLSLGARIGEPADLPALLKDLESGNLALHLLQHVGAAVPIGPILMGTRLPAHLLQYGMMVEEVVNLVTIGIVEAASLRRSMPASP